MINVTQQKAPKRMRKTPVEDVRKDGYARWPAEVKNRGRCKHCQKNITTTICTKCDVRLCFVEQRNCFMDFHN